MKNMTHQSNNNPTNLLQGKVILIINGLSEAGFKLAALAASKGADIAIVDLREQPDLVMSLRIQHEVEGQNGRCLIITLDWPLAKQPSAKQPSAERPMADQILQTIITTLGRLDAVVTYSDDSPDLFDPGQAAVAANGSASQASLFDLDGLTQEALRQIKR
jgi:NAD(P)-dependent dehydrogenase (short-subunit alcohol dehydrogenase family)